MARSWRLMFMPAALVAAACALPAQSTSQVTVASVAAAVEGTAAGSGETAAPQAQGSLLFAVVGDTGTGERAQYETAAMLARSHSVFPFEFVLMVGDNMYGSERPQDFVRKFELPFKPLLDANVAFYAALGNHDDPNQRFYKPFNMNGQRYYTFRKQSVRFFALDSNYMDREQLAWLDKELAASGSDWKIAFFHHPLYSSGGTHGSEVDLRTQVEPLFLKHGVSVVFAGHEHFYERVKPQRGIQHFTAGGSAKLREGDIRKTNLTEVGYDTDRSYMLVEISGDQMNFQTVNRLGKSVDSGKVVKVNATSAPR